MAPSNSPKPNPRSHKKKNSKNRVNDGEDAKFLDGLGITRRRNGTFGKKRPDPMILQARKEAKEAERKAKKEKEEAERKALLAQLRFPRECRLPKPKENSGRSKIEEVLSSDDEEEEEEDQNDKDYVFSTAYGKQRKRGSGIRTSKKSGTGSMDKQMADTSVSDEDDEE
ncbi:hypothetical protein GCK72_026067 [Caenorhabditis remanei]|uniref:Uncharacterized protein n=1 Tax=Caenorhabditis remanei TaxID=31234 RepID=A0A6A5G532_CAERE|nr:hypothetical protein GCK72_026067 [Caenorhabditis remanei]KAF1749599.1 hypothetical protein GCK72_026067 [Caenorhabditis remanei]